jgi:glycosyltransferase involved in cell wall biosynthesis
VTTSAPVRVLELRSVRGTGGGPEKTILRGAESANRECVDVSVCYLRDARDPDYAVEEQARRFKVEYVEVRERHSLDRAAWAAVLALVRARGIEIVHAHDYKTDLMALWLRRRAAVVPLATAHGWTGNSRRERILYYPADKKLLARFPAVVAVSQQIRQELIRNGTDPGKVTVLLNGIDAHTFRRDSARSAQVRTALGLLPGVPVIGSIGRLEQQKRFDVLLDAIGRLRQTGREVVVLIAGEGSQRPALASLAAQLGLERAVQLLGHRTDVIDLHHAFDVFVQSSDYEGTPNAVLEAMALETPIVATSAGGTAEIAFDGTHALLVPCGDAERLSAAVGSVLDDAAAARARAAAARMRVEQDLSFDARTRRLELIYLELARRGRSAAVAS